jgi:hypothetical protein
MLVNAGLTMGAPGASQMTSTGVLPKDVWLKMLVKDGVEMTAA